MKRVDDSPGLEVGLGATRVGRLERSRQGAPRFSPDPAWLDGGQRPPLGLAFLQDPRPRPAPPELPAWFENLLPEGALRRWLCKKHGLRTQDRMALLAALGEDLPGAVWVRGDTPPDDEDGADPPDVGADRYRFSLAGMQLKLSMSLSGDRLSIPARGASGRWIVKLPDPERPTLPEIEHATMAWARAVGLEVPDSRVIELEQLEGVEPELLERRSRAFAIQRFDRSPDGRVHQEDFAQALGLRPSDRYADNGVPISYDGLAKLVGDACGPEDQGRFVERLAFVVASGNDDAHLKNWSLQWAANHRPWLSPAYDQVCTLAYALDRRWARRREGPTLALALGRQKHFARLDLQNVESFVKRGGVPQGRERLIEALERAWRAWPAVEAAAPEPMRDAILRLWATVPVLRFVKDK